MTGVLACFFSFLVPVGDTLRNVALDDAFAAHDVVASVRVVDATLEEFRADDHSELRSCHINVKARVLERFKGDQSEFIHFSTPLGVEIGAQYLAFLASVDNAAWFERNHSDRGVISAAPPDASFGRHCISKAWPLKADSFPQRLMKINYDSDTREGWVDLEFNNIVFPDDIPVIEVKGPKSWAAQYGARRIQLATLRRHLLDLAKRTPPAVRKP